MSAEILSWTDKVSLRQWVKTQDLNPKTFPLTHLQKFSESNTKPGQIWGAFHPIQNEPKVNWDKFTDTGIKFCFPKITDQGLKFFTSKKFSSGIFGLLEPEGGDEIESKQMTGLFVPGLAFDNRGQRLGRGKAYYDQFLTNFLGLKVGLTWSQFYILGAMPTDSWDVPMDFIVTEKFIYQPLSSTKG